MTTTQKKFDSLQILRALAAWTVVYHHYMQLYFGLESENMIGSFFSQHGAMGVDVFFVISGFVMYLSASNNSNSPASFIINRAFRVAPIYWFYCALVIACIYLFPGGFAYTSFDLKSLVATALFVPSWNPSGLGYYPVLTVGWTLNFEMFFYSALAFCMAISSRHFFKILFIVFVILPLVYPRSLYFSPIAGSFLLYEFLAGAVLAGAWVHPRTTHVIEKYRGLMLSLAVVLILAGIKMLTSLGAKLPIAVAIVVSALLYEHYLRRDSLLVKQLVKLGDESYSTYLSHCIVIGIAVHYTGKNLGQMAQISILLAITCTVYLMSAASFRWLEKSKCLESLRCATVRIFTRDGQESTGMARSSADKTTTPGASE